MEKILVVNAGSSSLKFSLYDMPSEKEIVNGYIEKIGLDDSFWQIKVNGEKKGNSEQIKNHSDAVKVMIRELLKNHFVESLDEIKGVGHRILHGGEIYKESVVINDKVLKDIADLTKLGPLHHPGEIAGIKAMQEALPNVKEVAVFDTAFHQTMPEYNYIYAVPYEWYTKNHVRRYGFHGTSHKYLTGVMKEKLNKEKVNLIICHVGSGASISCIKDGICFDTSMGLTPLDGLVMGTRCGEVDPAIIKYMMEEENYTIEEIDNILNKKSGLLGICGKSDFRDVIALKKENNERANLAYKIYKDSIIKHIAEYYFELNGDLDAIVFSAGVLENNSMLREDIINDLNGPIGLILDKETNQRIGASGDLKEGLITKKESKYPVYVIPTSEEIMILRDTYNLI